MRHHAEFDGLALLHRVVISAAVGAALAGIWVGLAALMVSTVVCGDGLGCLLWTGLLLPSALVLLVALACPILMAFRVRWAWLVALIAPVAALAFAQGFTHQTIELGGNAELAGFGWLVLTTAAGYAVAALVSAPGLTLVWRTVVVVPVVVLFGWVLFWP